MKLVNEFWAFIPARSGSKGIKNKNIVKLGKLPLLAYSIIAALKGAGMNGKVLVTGQDASDAGITNILIGDQSMTVYKSLQAQAKAAAEGAVAMAKGEDTSSIFPETVVSDAGNVPALLLQPMAVDKLNIASTVIKDGFTMKEKVCIGDAAKECDF